MPEILIADDHPLYRDAIANVIEKDIAGSITYQVDDFQAAIAFAEEHDDLDLVLLDLNMPGMDGFNGLIQFRNRMPTLPVAIISAEQDREIILHSITCGAAGFVCKTAERNKISEAINQILKGQVYLPPDIIRSNITTSINIDHDHTKAFVDHILHSLTRRQLVVLERLSNGYSNKQIAYELKITEATVKAHVSAILRKLKVTNRAQAIIYAGKINFDKYLKQ